MVDIKVKDYVYKKVSEGSVVGRLTVIERCGKAKNGAFLWRCICECGNEKVVNSSALNCGNTQSCGCKYNEIKGKQSIRHGETDSKEHIAWRAMKQRCYYAKHDYYDKYGGRGIKVCDEWIDSFENFLSDMGRCPEGMSLDRIDVNGNYCKENCQWATHSDQGFNKGMFSSNTSGRTGVSFHKGTSKWAASITLNNKQLHLGVFTNFEDAVKAREAAELKYFGFIKE